MTQAEVPTGPDEFALGWYIEEIEWQAGNGLAARDELVVALRTDDFDGVFRRLHALLASVAAIRRLLLPNRQASRPGKPATERGLQLQAYARQRGRLLRRALGINPEASALTQERLRNVLEHLDEYIDEWFLDGNTIIFDRNMLSAGTVVVNGEPAVMLRNYDSETHIASVLDTEVELAPIILALIELRAAAQKWIAGSR